jgi:hypothetical protein
VQTTFRDSTAGRLQAGTGPLWVCEGAFDALALRAAGVSRVVTIFGVQGWRWEWARDVRALVFALAAAAAGQQQGRQLARQAARLPAAAYGGGKAASATWCRVPNAPAACHTSLSRAEEEKQGAASPPGMPPAAPCDGAHFTGATWPNQRV